MYVSIYSYSYDASDTYIHNDRYVYSWFRYVL